MERNQRIQASSKLTHFAPLSPEANQPGVGFQLLSKFFSFNKDSSVAEPITSTHSNASSDVPGKSNSSWKPADNSEQSDTISVSQFPVNVGEGRSLPNVLKRISNLLALKSTNLQSYKDTDFKQYWMPDSVSRECYDCEEKFTTFRRRHHCRVCGQIFCSKCCNQEIPGKIMGCTDYLRVCTYCSKVVLSYLQSSDMGADLSSDLRALQEDLQTKFGSVSSSMISIAPNSSNTTSSNSVEGQDNSVPRRKLSAGFQEDKFALGRAQGTGYHSMEERCQALQKSASLRTLFDDLCNPTLGITLQTHRYRLRNYHGCFMGSELVDWLLTQNRAATRVQGTAIGQALTEGGYLEPVAERSFADGYSLYRPREMPLLSPTSSVPSTQSRSSSHDNQEPLWVKEIPQEDSSTTTDSESEQLFLSEHDDSVSIPSSSSTFYLDLNVDSNTVHISRPKPGDETAALEAKSKHKPPQVPSPVHDCAHVGMSSELLMLQSSQSVESGPATSWYKASSLRTENEELECYSRLSSVFKQHELSLLKQLLNMEAISQTWVDIVLPLAEQIVDTIRPDVRNEADEMDIRQYVQFKKVPGGSRSESCIVSGVVCTKNVAHRAMSMRHTNPQILLLGCSIVYQRIEGRLMSIEPVMMQEREYLRHVVARIAALHPDIILVHRSVSRLAQELLLALKVTLVLHVKASVLERVARLTHADIATSVDAHIGMPRLGTCRSFYLRTFPAQRGSPSKTLMFFEGCKFPHLGCTVLLRGAPIGELAKVKRVASQMLFARYNWRLEKSFLMDEFARPPNPPTDTFFEEETNKTSPKFCETPKHLVKKPSAESENLLGPEIIPQNQSISLSSEMPDELNLSKDPSTNANSIEGSGLGRCSTQNSTTEISEKCLDRRRKSGLDNGVNVLTMNLLPKIANLLEDNTNNEGECVELRHDRSQTVRVSSKDKLLGEDKKINVESVSDFSDPLHQYMNLEDEVFIASQQGSPATQSMAVAELPLSNKFRKALDDTILCVSPFLKFPVPFLETEAGKHCILRQYFPQEIFWSSQFCPAGSTTNNRSSNGNTADMTSINNIDHRFKGVKLLPQHPFVSAKLTSDVDSSEVQTLLAHFRACGGRVTSAPTSNTRHVSVAEEQTSAGVKQQQPDVLDTANHQKLAVLFCSYSHHSANAPAFCVNPWVVHMDLYGRNDIPLGSFLERYCFRLTYVCPSDTCETPMLQHIRRFVHDSGCLHIALKQLDRPIQPDSVILMWSWCSKCKLVSPVVPMSTDTWGLSFAKYLELRFHGGSYTRRGPANTVCSHSLHHDHYQYFGFKNIVASFKYTSVAVWEVSLPPPLITICHNPHQQSNIIEEIKTLALKGYEVYSAVLEKLCALGQDTEGVATLKLQRSQEHAIFKSCIEEIQLKLTSPTLESKKMEGKISEKEVQLLMWRIEDSVVHLKFYIAEAVSSWNVRIQEFVIHTKKKDEKSRKSTDSSKLLMQSSSHSLEGEGAPRMMEDIVPFNLTPLSVDEPSIFSETATSERALQETKELEAQEISNQEPKNLSTVSTELSESECSSTVFEQATLDDSGLEEHKETVTPMPPPPPAHLLPGNPPDTSVSSFESPTMEGLEAGLGVQKVWVQQHDFVLVHHTDVPEEQPSSSSPSQNSMSQPQVSPAPSSHTTQGSPSAPNSDSQVVPPEEIHEGKQPHQSSDKKYVKTILAQLRPSSTNIVLIQNPLSPQEHLLSVNGVAIPSIVYENEPSSIISYALSSLDYRRTLDEIRSRKQNEQPTPSPVSKRKSGLLQSDKDSTSELTSSIESRRSAVLSFLRGTNTNVNSNNQVRTGALNGVQYSTSATVGDPSFQESEEPKTESEKTSKGSKTQSNLYIEIQFSDSTTNFFCRVYFAEPFAALRQMVLPAGEEGFIRSLGRCVQWAARGGKSGSNFCKTRDDRFILKEMSRLELQLFLEFAPHYFSYVMRCHASNQPTLLGKIVGVYQVVYRNATTNATLRSNLLVMENLFYSRSVTHKFDLKGSVRNRLVNPSDDHQGEIVLLDENLLKMTCDSPLYMLPHSKSVLTRAIDNDTQFLASQSVMDYSLLVGLDEDKRELVIGIIDYIRTFTWDKKLETMVKSSGILGGQGKLPTVVSPELYRARFIASMHQYFLPVPDRWTGLGQELD